MEEAKSIIRELVEETKELVEDWLQAMEEYHAQFSHPISEVQTITMRKEFNFRFFPRGDCLKNERSDNNAQINEKCQNDS